MIFMKKGTFPKNAKIQHLSPFEETDAPILKLSVIREIISASLLSPDTSW
jgi:hypothetical protein